MFFSMNHYYMPVIVHIFVIPIVKGFSSVTIAPQSFIHLFSSACKENDSLLKMQQI